MKKYLTTIIAVMFFIANFTFVFAAEQTATIKGQHIVENNTSLKSFNNVFVLKSIDNAPMPEGSSNGIKEITVPANEEFSFGDIVFPEKGTYEYRVERKITESKSLKADDSVYLVKIQASVTGAVNIVYQKEGEEGKSDNIKYVDTYIEPYTIIFDPNGGVFEDGSKENVIITGYAGDKITILNATTKEGYTFKYWKGSEYYPGQEYTITEDHTFVAQYEEAKTVPDDNDKNDTSKNKSSGKAKTGDTNELVVYLSVFVIGALCALIIYKKSIERKKTK